MNTSAKIESLLFFKGEPITIKKIGQILKLDEGEIIEALNELRSRLVGTGLEIIEIDGEVNLGTNKEASPFLEELRKDELTKDLSKASLETMSIILYKNGITRSEIDYIRGVNSNFILRNLLIRGLIKKDVDPKDARRSIYIPTLETLQFMGITKIEDLPRYQEVRDELQKTLNGELVEQEVTE